MKLFAFIQYVLCVLCLWGRAGDDKPNGQKAESTKGESKDGKPGKKDEKTAEAKVEEKKSLFEVFPAPDGRAYFPKGREHWYTKYLSVMKEPSLLPIEKETAGWSLRFTWLRTFHEPIAVRIWKDGDHYQMRAVKLSGKGGYEAGKIAKDVTRRITAEEWKQLQQGAESKELWKPLSDSEDLLQSAGTDGAQWIFERRIGGEYTFSDVWCAREMTMERIRELGLDPAKTRDFGKVADFGLLLVKWRTFSRRRRIFTEHTFMRGFPFLNLLIALVLSGAVVLPLVWRATHLAVTPVAAAADQPAESENRVPSHISLRFVHAPAKVRLAAGDTVLHEWTAPNGALLLEDTIPLTLSGDRIEFSLQIEWPAGTTDPTNVVLEVEPERRESRKDIYWSSGGTVDEIVTLSWKP